MPPANYLPVLQQVGMDLLVLRPNINRNYISGVSGFGTTLENAVAGIREWLKATGYTKVYVLGTSGGTLPAIYSSIVLNAERCVAVGTIDPRGGQSEVNWTQVVTMWEAMNPSQRPMFVFTDGQLAVEDRMASQFVVSQFGGRVFRVPGADHNSLHPLWQKGLFAQWLKWALCGDSDHFPGESRLASVSPLAD